MTILAGFRFDNGAVIVADSRATWTSSLGALSSFQDELQKIMPLDRKIAIGYAGDVQLANLIANQIKKRIREKKRLRHPQKLSTEVTRIARHYFRLHKSRLGTQPPVVFLLGGVTDSGNILIYSYESPKFERNELKGHFTIMGSGSGITPIISEKYAEITAQDIDLKKRADLLRGQLESALSHTSIPTVGGFFQIILLDEDGVRPLNYGLINLNPFGEGEAKRIYFQSGRWIQQDERQDITIPLLTPSELSQKGQRHFEFHDFRLPDAQTAKPHFHLTYFLTCMENQLDVGTAEFRGIYSQMAAVRYPITFPNRVALGFWGPAGTYPLEFFLEQEGSKKEVFSSDFTINYAPEEQDLFIEFPLSIERPGPVFLECHLNGEFLGRRALYFGTVEEPALGSPRERQQFHNTLTEKILALHRNCSDPVIEGKGTGTLVYFHLCQGCSIEDTKLKFKNQFLVIYSKAYPLRSRVHVASAFRFSPGPHQVRLSLVNAATREEHPFNTASIEASSSCIVSPIHGDLIMTVPGPGIYFVKIYIDDEHVGTALLAAETEKPVYSYTLSEDQEKAIAAGQVSVLLKRSESLDEAKQL
ncbi:MAG: hypothetical protein HOC91_17890 [Nitrospinaceae bacterium]|nr:hypothetical protein [Nitrospinaceae bacterium]MBT3434943.1 hypothetical protein [Nitrospinaceae bacterium]MBT3822541.1 hypothetical protein [Nitrospinaceae bacterium]MBT4094305.1 hypothetical protein [Nitrospinaceae bacterium]MBT4432385.1 hypothetical protein [Nitrospinaceae bacterium]